MPQRGRYPSPKQCQNSNMRDKLRGELAMEVIDGGGWENGETLRHRTMNPRNFEDSSTKPTKRRPKIRPT